MTSIPDKLKKVLRGKILILGVGNRLLGDDGAGSWLIEKLPKNVFAEIIDGGCAPENYLEKIVKTKPDTILIIDAVNFDGAHGEIRVVPVADIHSRKISTHGLSLGTLGEYLGSRISARIYVIGIQSGSTKLGEIMGSRVSESIERLAETLKALLAVVN